MLWPSRPYGKRRRRWLLLALFVTAGCNGGEDTPTLVPVTGIVTMNDQPMAEVIVTFRPTGKTLGNGALGGTDTEGRFTLSDVRGGTGAHAGEYKISLYPAPGGGTAELPAGVVSSRATDIPAIFMNPSRSPLRATVPASGAEVEIALTPNGKGSMVNVKPVTAGD